MGMKIISIGQLQKGDIILSTTNDPVSKVVKFVTDSKYSHARIYIGNQDIIEAIDPKVRDENIIKVMEDDLYTAVYRYPGLTLMQKIKIVHYASQ
jgi:cell wall-associated NlpC family hydrolase